MTIAGSKTRPQETSNDGHDEVNHEFPPPLPSKPSCCGCQSKLETILHCRKHDRVGHATKAMGSDRSQHAHEMTIQP